MTIDFWLTLAAGAATAFVLALAVNECFAWRGVPRRQGFYVERDDET